MRRYRPEGDDKTPARAGVYRVPFSPCPVTRPTRNAAGMSATDARRKGYKPKTGEAALTLAVRGTLDPLASTRFDLERVPCPCCGNKGAKVRLKAKSGRVRLAQIRQSRPKNKLPR